MLRQIFGRITTATKMATGLPMNGLDLLRQDHMRVEAIAVQLRLSRDRNKRKHLFEEMSQALDRHMRIEETIFYPACARIRRLSSSIDHAHADHQLFKNALKDLAVLDPSTGQFNDLLMKAVVEVEMHVYQEENRVFMGARKYMSSSEFRWVNRRIMEAHAEESVQRPRSA